MSEQNLRIPPHSIEAEKSVLGACLIDKDAVLKVAEILGRDDSDDDSTNQNLIAAFMVSISAQGKTDEREFTGADVARFKGLIPSRSWQELNQAVHRIIVASLAFDRMGDAGFFPKS